MHFSLAEGLFSSTAERLGIRNDAPPNIVANMVEAAKGMEEVRLLLGQPIHIDSWYRCPQLNKAVGGARASSHMEGYAIDFICPNYGSPKDIVKLITRSSIRYDKLIFEGNWVHISFAPELRCLALTAVFNGQGGVSYSEGV